MNSSPLISVIITTYYRNEDLKRAIESVQHQTYEPIEIIVVDDSGEANARSVVDEFAVEYVPKEQNEGQISAWNSGIDRSNGDYIQFLDDDDQLCPTKIDKQMAKFKESEKIGVLYCGMSWETGGTVLPNEELRGDVLDQVLTLSSSPCVTSTLLIKREFLTEIHPIPRYPASTDEVLKIELAQLTEFDYVDEPLIIRGEGDSNVSRSMQTIDVSWQILEDYESLYSERPENVRMKAISNTYYSKSRMCLQRNFWSVKARAFLLYSLFKSPDIDRRSIVLLLRSIGGMYAVRLAGKVKRVKNRIATAWT